MTQSLDLNVALCVLSDPSPHRSDVATLMQEFVEISWMVLSGHICAAPELDEGGPIPRQRQLRSVAGLPPSLVAAWLSLTDSLNEESAVQETLYDRFFTIRSTYAGVALRPDECFFIYGSLVLHPERDK